MLALKTQLQEDIADLQSKCKSIDDQLLVRAPCGPAVKTSLHASTCHQAIPSLASLLQELLDRQQRPAQHPPPPSATPPAPALPGGPIYRAATFEGEGDHQLGQNGSLELAHYSPLL